MGHEQVRCIRDKKALRDMVGLSDSITIYELTAKVNLKLWTKVTEVVENEYINPFGLEVGKNSLVKTSFHKAIKLQRKHALWKAKAVRSRSK